MNAQADEARHNSGRTFRDTRGEQPFWHKIALATECYRAIDLSRRACDACGAGAGCWAWIPGGGLRSAPLPAPTSDKNENMTLSRNETGFKRFWASISQPLLLTRTVPELHKIMQRDELTDLES